jgi:hypothetical protein
MEELIPILIFVAWIVISLLGRLAKGLDKKKTTEGGSQPSAFEQAMREIARQAGLAEEEPAVEPPVASEHRPSPGERRPTATEHAQAYGETWGTAAESEPTASEIRPTFSEYLPRPSEHLPTPGEHLHGDVVVSPIALSEGRPKQWKTRSPFASAVVRDLRGGRSIARAVVLREILGPPVGLRSPGEGPLSS